MNPTIEKTLRGHKACVTAVSFNPSPAQTSKSTQRSIQVASSSRDGTLTLWTIPQAGGSADVRAYKLVGHSGPVHHVTFSASGHLLASCSTDKTVRLWLPKATGESVVLSGHSAAVRCVDFSPTSSAGGSLLLTCSDDKSLKVWDLPNRRFRSSLLGHKNWVRKCAFSPDTSNLAASGGDDKTLRLWDIERGENVITYDFSVQGKVRAGPVGSVRNLSFRPSAASIAASGTDGCIRIYDLRSDALMHHYQVASDKNKCSVDGLSFAHPSGNYLLSSNADGSVLLWDVRQGQIVYSYGENPLKKPAIGNDPTSCVSFSQDGEFFAGSSAIDKTVLVWKTNGRSPKAAVQQTPCKNRPSTAPARPASRSAQKTRTTVPSRDFVLEDIADEELQGAKPPITQDENTSNTTTVETSSEVGPRKVNGDSTDHHKEKLPELLAGTLDSIVSQLTLLTQTLATFEQRLSLQEKALAQLQAEQADQRLYLQSLKESKGNQNDDESALEAKVQEFLSKESHDAQDTA